MEAHPPLASQLLVLQEQGLVQLLLLLVLLLEELDLQNLVGAFLQQGSPYTYSHSREKIEIDPSAASVFIHSHSN